MGRVRAKVRKHQNKTRGTIAQQKIEVYDEWEHHDIDRDEQMAGLARRERRYKEIELDQKKAAKLEQEALAKADKIGEGKSILRDPTPLEEAWLRCDFLLANIMVKEAYEFMEWQRLNDVDAYKKLYRIFMSKAMMRHAQTYVDYFAKGGKSPIMITYPNIIKAYKKIKGIKTKIRIVHKGEEDHEL